MRSFYISEDRYTESMHTIAEPYLNARRHDMTLRAEDGADLFVSVFDADRPVGSVTIVHGFTSCIEKFRELIWIFLQSGLSVCIYDQRGHGRSHRDVADPALTHVERFDDYVSDLETVCEKTVAGMPAPHYLFAHSMGGAVSVLYLEKGGTLFRKAVLCSPMIAPNRSGMPLWLAECVTGLLSLAGQRRKRPFFMKPAPGPEPYSETFSNSRERFEYYQSVRDPEPLFSNNGPTCGWILESLKVTKRILRKGAPGRVAVPVKLYSAEKDFAVLIPEQKKFTDACPEAQFISVPGAYHEIYRCRDEIVFPFWDALLDEFAPTED